MFPIIKCLSNSLVFLCNLHKIFLAKVKLLMKWHKISHCFGKEVKCLQEHHSGSTCFDPTWFILWSWNSEFFWSALLHTLCLTNSPSTEVANSVVVRFRGEESMPRIHFVLHSPPHQHKVWEIKNEHCQKPTYNFSFMSRKWRSQQSIFLQTTNPGGL